MSKSSTWAERAGMVIWETHKTLPENMPLIDRKREIRKAYPWGERKGWPYKAWLQAQREYLKRYHTEPHPKNLTPLEKAIVQQKAIS